WSFSCACVLRGARRKAGDVPRLQRVSDPVARDRSAGTRLHCRHAAAAHRNSARDYAIATTLETDGEAEPHVRANAIVEMNGSTEMVDDGNAGDDVEIDQHGERAGEPLGVADAGAEQQRALRDDIGVHARHHGVELDRVAQNTEAELGHDVEAAAAI